MSDRMHVEISNLRFTPSDAATVATGQLGWLAFDLGPLRIADVQLRKSASGRIYLSFSRSHRSNRESCTHFALRPTSDDSRLALEIAIFAVLRPRPETAAS